MKLIIFLFSYLAIAQSLPIRVQEEGISNYQINANNPGSTPLAGYKYLYDQNSVLMRKDNSGNVERVRGLDTNNVIGNPDVEQGLTPYFISSGGMTLNETTPLEGKRSIDSDATATDDFVETQLYPIPIGLMGQNCMARVLVKGGDANLQVQVLNGAGTVIGFKQLGVFLDSSSQYIAFTCPTQAEVTTTPQLGQFKIKIVQTTATDAALVTLDKFYLGEFASNSLSVMEQQWYFYSANSDISGNFTFPTPVDSFNDKSIFTYTGSTLTVLKPIQINFQITAFWAGGNSNNASISSTLNCTTKNGTRDYFNNPTVQSQATPDNMIMAIFPHANLILDAGDTCTIVINRAANTIARYAINIIANTKPEIATVVSSSRNNPIGFWASKEWTQGGTVTNNSTTYADLAGNFTGTAILDGKAVADDQTSQITLSEMPHGHYLIFPSGGFGNASPLVNSPGCQLRGLLNGTTPIYGSGSTLNISSGTAGVIAGISTMEFYNPSDLTNANIKFQARRVNATSCVLGTFTTDTPFRIVIYYFPDDTKSYTTEILAALPPQITSPNGRNNILGATRIANNGTASIVTTNLNAGFLASVNRTALGIVRNTFASTFNPSEFVCIALPEQDVKPSYTNGVGFVDITFTNNAGAGVDTNYNLQCVGI